MLETFLSKLPPEIRIFDLPVIHAFFAMYSLVASFGAVKPVTEPSQSFQNA